jgi:hypothetical protein
MKSCYIPSGLNSKKVCEGAKIFHGKISLQFVDNGGESFLVIACENDIIHKDPKIDMYGSIMISKERGINL